MTPRQSKLIEFICAHRAQYGCTPTRKEMQHAIAVRHGSTVEQVIGRCTRIGLLVMDRGLRSLRPAIEKDSSMIWGCLSCVTHKIGGRSAIQSQEFHTLTISSEQPKCRACGNAMSALNFNGPQRPVGGNVQIAKPNGHAHPSA